MEGNCELLCKWDLFSKKYNILIIFVYTLFRLYPLALYFRLVPNSFIVICIQSIRLDQNNYFGSFEHRGRCCLGDDFLSTKGIYENHCEKSQKSIVRFSRLSLHFSPFSLLLLLIFEFICTSEPISVLCAIVMIRFKYVNVNIYLMHIYVYVCMYILMYTYLLSNILEYYIVHLVHALKATGLSMWETIKSNAKESRENSAEPRKVLACP